MALIYRTQQLTEVWATSGSSQNIQNAIDQVVADGGGNVYVPEGDFEFNIYQVDPCQGGNWMTGVIVPGGVNIIGAGKDKTILRETLPPYYAHMFCVDGRNNLPTRISGITCISYKFSVEDDPPTRGIAVYNAADYRIDNCRFEDFSSKAIAPMNVAPYGANRGLIDHSDFDNPYKDNPNIAGTEQNPYLPPTFTRKMWGYGIVVTGRGSWEDINNLLGKYDGVTDVVYVEDCNFSRCRHSIASNTGAWYVIRHSIFSEPRPEHFGIIDVHGVARVSDAGGRGLEAYENTIQGCIYPVEMGNGWLSIAFGLRGGGGVVFNNSIIDCNVGLKLEKEYEDWKIRDLYVWSNQLSKESAPSNGTLISTTVYVQDVDYFLHAKDGYIPYPYPHPLTLEEPQLPATPWSDVLEEATYKITMPTQVVSDTETYNFKQWEDGSTNPIRTINLIADTILSATYELAPPQPDNTALILLGIAGLAILFGG